MTVKATHHSELPVNGGVPFVRPKFSLAAPVSSTPDALATLPDIVEFNAFHNPTHLFCVQYGRNMQDIPHSVSFADLYNAVLRCSAWLSLGRLAQGPRIVNGVIVKPQPVAILMASDVGWFITFLALLRLGIPVSPHINSGFLKCLKCLPS